MLVLFVPQLILFLQLFDSIYHSIDVNHRDENDSFLFVITKIDLVDQFDFVLLTNGENHLNQQLHYQSDFFHHEYVLFHRVIVHRENQVMVELENV